MATLPDGLEYKIITEGSGERPTASDTVTVNYRGTLIDGTEFDSSAKHGQAATFRVNGVIHGWTEALQLMKPGAKWQLFIPAGLAYGEPGNHRHWPASGLNSHPYLRRGTALHHPTATAPAAHAVGSARYARSARAQPVTSDIIRRALAAGCRTQARREDRDHQGRPAPAVHQLRHRLSIIIAPRLAGIPSQAGQHPQPHRP